MVSWSGECRSSTGLQSVLVNVEKPGATASLGDSIGCDPAGKGRGTVDASFHVALGRKMYDRARPVLREHSVEQLPVTDVATYESVPRTAIQCTQVLEIAGVSQRIQVDNRLIGPCYPVEDKAAADDDLPPASVPRQGSSSAGGEPLAFLGPNGGLDFGASVHARRRQMP